MKVIADTHVALWWYLDAPGMPAQFMGHLEACEGTAEPVGVSAISLWEIAKLAELGRIRLRTSVDELLTQIDEDPLFEVIPLSGQIAAESTRLGASFHRDLADQLIAATARCLGLRLMTADERIRDSGVVALF
jgi:PIN domain nuclease of toxin-antitoxin system